MAALYRIVIEILLFGSITVIWLKYMGLRSHCSRTWPSCPYALVWVVHHAILPRYIKSRFFLTWKIGLCDIRTDIICHTEKFVMVKYHTILKLVHLAGDERWHVVGTNLCQNTSLAVAFLHHCHSLCSFYCSLSIARDPLMLSVRHNIA